MAGARANTLPRSSVCTVVLAANPEARILAPSGPMVLPVGKVNGSLSLALSSEMQWQ